jgi:hypothetical protein
MSDRLLEALLIVSKEASGDVKNLLEILLGRTVGSVAGLGHILDPFHTLSRTQ